jgi:hypothetical protein
MLLYFKRLKPHKKHFLKKHKIIAPIFGVIGLEYYFCTPKTTGAIAQLVEQWTENPCVPGSNPGSTTFKNENSKYQKYYFWIWNFFFNNIMVIVVQLVRTPDCDSGGRGFKSHHSPKSLALRKAFFV